MELKKEKSSDKPNPYIVLEDKPDDDIQTTKEKDI